jgi:hypothetical protein
MSILLFASASMQAATDEPGPFERMFRSLRRAFSEPHQKPRPHHSKQQSSSSASKSESPTPAPTETAVAVGNKPPNDRNTRTTVRANSKRGEDLRYGIPVPGKNGFVTSPYSPDSGYIDVRGFQPGTPVKDPYTGKIFLTP